MGPTIAGLTRRARIGVRVAMTISYAMLLGALLAGVPLMIWAIAQGKYMWAGLDVFLACMLGAQALGLQAEAWRIFNREHGYYR